MSDLPSTEQVNGGPKYIVATQFELRARMYTSYLLIGCPPLQTFALNVKGALWKLFWNGDGDGLYPHLYPTNVAGVDGSSLLIRF